MWLEVLYWIDHVNSLTSFGTLIGVFVFRVMWPEYQRVECVFTSPVKPVWYVCDVLYAVLYVRACSFVVRGCAVWRRYINVCNCDVFSVVNVYLDHLKSGVVCICGRLYVCCSECIVVSNECN